MAEKRFTIRAHIGGGPWKWSVWDSEKQEAVGLHIEREDAKSTAEQLNKEGFVDA